MIIRELEHSGGVIRRAMQARQAESDKARPAGLHISTIINHYIDTTYPETRRAAIIDKQRIALYETGDILEQVIADELAKRAGWVKPKPKLVRGVWFSPDGHAHASRTIDEMKSTRISCSKIVCRPTGQIDGIEEHPKLLRYVIQLKLYLYVWQCDRGRLHVLFLNGNWKPPFPDPRTFILRPESTHELKDTYEQMMDHASEWGLLK